MSIAWIFPGQGSQAEGMGADLVELPGVKETLEKAEAILGWSLLELTAEQLGQTTFTQPALYTVEALLVDQLKGAPQPAAVAGHSLGEYSALYSAGVFDFETGLKLVQRRSQLMSQAESGTMAAVMWFDRETLSKLCDETADVVIANDNSPDQVVLSGGKEAISSVIEAASPKRSIFLSVSGAFHSPYMADAAAEFASVLDAAKFSEATVPVYSNVTASASTDPAVLKANLAAQVTGSVRWRETVAQMQADGVDTLWEVGPGKVLSGLTRRIDRSLGRANVSNAETLASILA